MKPPWGCVDNMLTQAGSSSHSLAEGSKLRPSQEKFFFLSIFWELLGSKQLCSFTAGLCYAASLCPPASNPSSPLSHYSLPSNPTTHFPLHLSRIHLNAFQWYEWCLPFYTNGLPELHSPAEVLGAGVQHYWNTFPAISLLSNPSCNLIGQISSDIQDKMMPVLDKFCYSNVTSTFCHEIGQEMCCTLLFQPPEYSCVSVYSYVFLCMCTVLWLSALHYLQPQQG